MPGVSHALLQAKPGIALLEACTMQQTAFPVLYMSWDAWWTGIG
jgi:hypothetical protein